MHFKLWADEAMTTEYGLAAAKGRMQGVSFREEGEVLDFVCWFGAKDANIKLENAAAPGTGDIVLSVEDVLPQRSKELHTGAVFGAGNGCVYRVKSGGTGADASYPTDAGTEFADGTAKIVCLGARHPVSAVRLALAADALDTGGQVLALGKSIRGGAAVAVHVRISNTVAQLYDTLAQPMLALSLNECAVTAA